MKNDNAIKQEMKKIYEISSEFMDEPNMSAYADRLVEMIISHAKKLEELQNESFKNT